MLHANRPSPFWITVVTVEILAIGILGFIIWEKIGASFVASIYPIAQQSTGNDSSLSFFSEPIPGTTGPNASSTRPWMPKESPIRINENTLNHRRTFATTTQPNTYRVITLGDSWTFGVYVHPEKNFSGVLSKKLNQQCTAGTIKTYQVINLGVPGYDVQYAAERFLTRGADYQPDALVWLFSPGDFHTNTEEVRKRFHQYPDTNKTTSQARANLLTKIRRDIQNEVGKNALETFQIKSLERVITRFNGPILLFSVDSSPNGLKGAGITNKITTFAANHENVFYRSITPQWDNDASFPDRHPTEIGHERIATQLFHRLTTDDIIPCPRSFGSGNFR